MRRARYVLLAAGVLFTAGLATLPSALAQVETREGIALQNQIAELRQELQIMQQQQQTGGAPYAPQQSPYPQPAAPGPGPVGNDSTADLVVRVGTLEEQNRQLQGRIDDLTNQLQRQHDELAKQVGDLAFRMGQSPGNAGVTQGQAQDSLPPEAGSADTVQTNAARIPAAPPVSAHRTPELALREGNAALARRDYAAAEADAREALRGHSPHVVDAQFLLARAEGGEHQYKAAAADFYQAYNHAPKSGTAPVALLGVANALIALSDNHDACEALAKLTVEFPGAVKTGVSSARKRASCGR